MHAGACLLGEDEGVPAFCQAVSEYVWDRMGVAHLFVIEQRYVEPGMAHHAGHMQHQVARTPGGIVDAYGVTVVVLEDFADGVFRLVDHAEQLIDVVGDQCSRGFVDQQFGVFRYEAECGNQGAR